MEPSRISIYAPPDLKRRLRMAVAKHDTSAQAVLLPAIERAIEELERQDAKSVVVA